MTNFRKKLEEIIRVNQAGELGAQVIYQGQIAALKLKKDQESLKIVQHMMQQEVEHFEYFDQLMRQEKVRPTVMHPIWKVGGFAMGFLTALADKKAAMTCTTAVEEVIDQHYLEQLEFLSQQDLQDEERAQKISELKEKIAKFRDEEIEHRDLGYEHDAAKLKAFKPLSLAIKCATKTAIAISKKL